MCLVRTLQSPYIQIYRGILRRGRSEGSSAFGLFRFKHEISFDSRKKEKSPTKQEGSSQVFSLVSAISIHTNMQGYSSMGKELRV